MKYTVICLYYTRGICVFLFVPKSAWKTLDLHFFSRWREYFEKKLYHIHTLLPLFLFTCLIRFVLNQTWLTLTKSIEKYSNNYTIQYLHYQHILHGRFNETNLVLQMLLFLSISLVKVCQVWLKTNLIRHVNKNRRSRIQSYYGLHVLCV